MLLSMVLFAYFFPRYDQWKEWVGNVGAVEKPIFWLHPSLLQMPELHQGGSPAPGLFSGQPEGGHSGMRLRMECTVRRKDPVPFP